MPRFRPLACALLLTLSFAGAAHAETPMTGLSGGHERATGVPMWRVDDIAAAVERAFTTGASGLFNVTDDEPAPPQDVVAYAAELMGVAPPPEQDFDTAELSSMARSFYGENKRVANGLSKSALGLVYDYPNYRSAFARMWLEDNWR